MLDLYAIVEARKNLIALAKKNINEINNWYSYDNQGNRIQEKMVVFLEVLGKSNREGKEASYEIGLASASFISGQSIDDVIESIEAELGAKNQIPITLIGAAKNFLSELQAFQKSIKDFESEVLKKALDFSSLFEGFSNHLIKNKLLNEATFKQLITYSEKMFKAQRNVTAIKLGDIFKIADTFFMFTLPKMQIKNFTISLNQLLEEYFPVEYIVSFHKILEKKWHDQVSIDQLSESFNKLLKHSRGDLNTDEDEQPAHKKLASMPSDFFKTNLTPVPCFLNVQANHQPIINQNRDASRVSGLK